MTYGGAGKKLWSNVMEILEEKDGVDTELLVFAMTLINKVSKYNFPYYWLVVNNFPNVICLTISTL